jgi:hypothetical protein
MHIGCGKNVLPPGWLNMDALPLFPELYLDATRRLPVSEHMIEDISYQHGFNVLAECNACKSPYARYKSEGRTDTRA